MPVWIGIAGGLFGMVAGIFGAIFGIMGAVAGAFFHVFSSVFGWGHDWNWPFNFHWNGFTILVIAAIIILLSRSRKI
jgi:hypothetical protein